MWPFTKRRGRAEPVRLPPEYVDPPDVGIAGRNGIVLVMLSSEWSPQVADWSRALAGGRLPDGSPIPSASATLTAELSARYGLSRELVHVLAVEAETGYVHARYWGGWGEGMWDHLLELAASGKPD